MQIFILFLTFPLNSNILGEKNVILAFVWKACCKNDINFMHTQSYKIKQIFPGGFCQHFLLGFSTNFFEGKGRQGKGR